MQLIVEYPDRLPDALRISRNQFELEARMAMAVKLFELARLTSGQAAQLAGMDRVEFIMNLHRYGVSPIQRTPEELAEDFANA
jgi:predicted HTH domain antitoxin